MLCRGRQRRAGDQPVEEWVGAVGGHCPGVLGHGGGHRVGAAILFHTGGQLVPQSQLLTMIGGREHMRKTIGHVALEANYNFIALVEHVTAAGL